MLPRIENVPTQAGSALSVRRFVEPAWPFNWHVHPEHELTLILRGQGQRYVGDHMEDFFPGDLVLIASNVPHTWQADPGSERGCESVVIQFMDDALGQDFFELPELASARQLLSRAQRGLRFTSSKDIAEELEALPEKTPSRRLLGFLNCLDLLANAPHTTLASHPATSSLRSDDQQRIDRVCLYVQEHHTAPIRLQEVADLAGMTRTSFCRFFQRLMGRPFMAYVHELRVSAACKLLTQTDLSVSDVCFRVGFGNIANFNRVFKRLRGKTPSQYRKGLLENAVLP